MMTRAIVPALCFALTAGCSSGVASVHARHRAVRTMPGSCNDASVGPVEGGQHESLKATGRSAATLGVRLLGVSVGTKRFDSVRIDVLPVGRHADPAVGATTSLLAGDEEHVRRFEATETQLRERTISFAFDGRDDTGAVLPAGSYEVGMVALTRALSGCDDPNPGAVYGQLTTVDWQPGG
jgi:hypothetical protein